MPRGRFGASSRRRSCRATPRSAAGRRAETRSPFRSPRRPGPRRPRQRHPDRSLTHPAKGDSTSAANSGTIAKAAINGSIHGYGVRVLGNLVVDERVATAITRKTVAYRPLPTFAPAVVPELYTGSSSIDPTGLRPTAGLLVRRPHPHAQHRQICNTRHRATAFHPAKQVVEGLSRVPSPPRISRPRRLPQDERVT
jgi:hypothetical protein